MFRIFSFFSLCLFNAFMCYSQRIVVVDSITKANIPFATIVSGTKGVYSDLNGVVLLPEDFKEITISHIGYNSKSIKFEIEMDTIFISPKPILLDEVIISPVGSNKINLGFLKRDKQISSLPILPNYELIIEIMPDPKYKDFKIEKIEIPYHKIKLYNKRDKIFKNRTAIFRLNVYTLQNEGNNLNLIYQSGYTNFIMSDKGSYSFDIAAEAIRFTNAAIYIDVELIGSINDKGEFVEDDTIMRPIITSEKSLDYSANTFMTISFNKNLKEMNNINSYNKYLERDIKNYESRDLNLAIGLIVSE